MRKENAKFLTNFISEAGSHLQNHDYFAFVELEKFACYVLADGMGADPVEGSAKTAVTEIIRLFMEKPSMKSHRLRKIAYLTNDNILKGARDTEPEVSIMILVTDYVKYRYAQAGHVRVCHIRNGALVHESKDMSLAAKLADDGKTTLDKVAEHEERHNLSCYIGQAPEKFFPHVSSKRKLADGDVLALYSRGIWEKIGAGEILSAADGVKTPDEWADQIEELLLTSSGEIVENYTFAPIFIDKIYHDAENRKKLIRKLLAIGIPILVIAIAITIVMVVRHNIRSGQLEDMNNSWTDARVAVETENFAKASEKADEAYALAQKMKLSYERQKLQDFTILIDHIIKGDEALREKNYKEAYDGFLAAQAKSYYCDLQAADYIKTQIKFAADHIELLDSMDRADAALDDGDYDAAEEYYKQARLLASALRSPEEKSLAQNGLDALRELRAKQSADDLLAQARDYEKRGDENPDIAISLYQIAAERYRAAGDSAAAGVALGKLDAIKSEEIQSEQNTATMQAQTEEQNGDHAFDVHQLDAARTQYLAAQEKYLKYGLTEMAQAVGEKLMLVYKAQQDESRQLEQAENYIKDGDMYYLKGEKDKARLLYQLARDIYKEQGKLSEMESAEVKIETTGGSK